MIIMNPNVGVAPGTTTMQLGKPAESPTFYWPYDNVARLRGLGAIGAPRWGLVLVAGLTAFSIMLGLRRWRGAR